MAGMIPAEALFGESLDFAGLYPPAKLDRKTTVKQFAALLDQALWFAGRLVWPAESLNELSVLAREHAPLVQETDTEGAWGITAVTCAANDPAFAKQLDAIASFNERHEVAGATALRADCAEIKVVGAADLDSALEEVPEDVFPYFEIDSASDPRGLITALAGMGAGAKIRMGGLDAASYPTVEATARFIMACARANVPFKATAGLHRAVRRPLRELGCHSHGFINVFTAAALAHGESINEAQCVELLADEDATHFACTERGVSWKSHHLSLDDAARSREDLFHSFGSCSWEEPLEDLAKLGITGVRNAQ
ncbi:MAG: hypothetical protein O2800_07380 [Planctomycetota bacterium]|nr:hypothetical protein [Planctomycetota bacterium]